MHRLFAPVLVVALVLACERAPAPDEEEADADTTAAVPTQAPADSVSRWIRAGEPGWVTNGEACLYVTAEGADRSQFGDSIRIAIAPIPARPDELPADADLPAAFRNAVARGQTVFPPVYRFSSYDATGRLFTEFSPEGRPVVVVAMCVTGRPEQKVGFGRAQIARPDPTDPESLQYFKWVKPPVECALTCDLRETGDTAQQASLPLGRWLAGTPLMASTAFAQCSTCFDGGIGSSGAGNSPFAAVDPLAGDPAGTAAR